MRKVVFVGALMAGAVMMLSSSAALADNWIGTWKMNAAKSKFSPGPAPKSQVNKWETTPAGTKFSGEIVDAEGKSIHTSWTSKLDGKDVPYDGNPNADTASPKKIDDNTYVNPWKKGGKPTMESKAVVAADGKTMTITQIGKNAKGEAVNNTVVYDKE